MIREPTIVAHENFAKGINMYVCLLYQLKSIDTGRGGEEEENENVKEENTKKLDPIEER